MIFLNTENSYGLIAQLLHWATAALILVLIPLGIYMHDLPVNSADEVVYKSWFYSLHKTLGVMALFVAIARVTWAAVQPHPKLLNADRTMESLAAQTVHWALYGSIILMPFAGWLHHSAAEGFAPIWWPLSQDLPLVPKSPQLASVFAMLHFFTGILLGLSLLLHVGGALKHVLIDRDETLQRMLPGRNFIPAIDLAEPRFKRLPRVLAVFAILIVGGATAANFAINNPETAVKSSAVGPTGAAAADWLVDKENSRLDIQILQMGQPVLGQFKTWSAAINFDPENLASARIEVEVDVASIALGAVSAQAISPDFLNAVAHPTARLLLETVTSASNNSYEAVGTLSVAGQTVPVTLPFELVIENGRAFVAGEAAVDRLLLGIGKKGFPGNDQLGIEVLVKVKLEAEKAPAQN